MIGFYDDYLKLVVGNSKGLAARYKYLAQSVAALTIALVLHHLHQSPAETSLYVPFFKAVAVPMSTTGFRGIRLLRHRRQQQCREFDRRPRWPGDHAGGHGGGGARACSPMPPATSSSRGYLQIPYINGVGEVLIFSATLVGAGLGFLWFNSYPAQVFMGDVGALAIGASLGRIAVIVRQEFVLFVMGGVFVIETVSVILQVASFKLTGKRIFRMAPDSSSF